LTEYATKYIHVEPSFGFLFFAELLYQIRAQLTNLFWTSVIPIDKLNIFALIAHSKSDAEFSPNRRNLLEPVSIASFSRKRLTETTYRLTSDYECMNSFSCGLDIQYNDVNDVIDNIYDSDQDGHAYIIMVTLKKTWN
jgi:hypothetical protein